MIKNSKSKDPFAGRYYLTYTRIPIAVHCWFPTGKDNEPIVTMFKFKEPDGDIITIRDIYNQCCEHYFSGTNAIIEVKCHIMYINRKREVILFYHLGSLKWEMTFLN